MRHGSLFSGIGGFDLAAEWMGWTNVFHCEWMEFPRQVLDYHFPDADSHIDICKTDFTKYANKIDILTGGFPCQPFSLAGKRKGTDDERYLWGEMLRAIQEIKPRFVIAENVFGITNIDGGLVFEQVCLDLEAEGYEVQPFIIPASAKNAPHRRDRCWFIAQNSLFSGLLHGESNQEGTEIREFGNTCTRSADGIYLSKRVASNTIGIRYRRSSKTERSNISRDKWQLEKNIGQHRNKVRSKIKRHRTHIGGIYWENFATQSPICCGDDGIPTQLDGITFSKWRAESIKGYGNAIVPQIAYQLFQIINEL
jgi:DNA (cytosine-5)-methyltransferase 1